MSSRFHDSLSIKFRNFLVKHRITRKIIHFYMRSQKRRWNIASLTKPMAFQAVLSNVPNEKDFWEYGKRDAKRLLPYIDSSSRVLDIGCGVGRIEKFIAGKCKEVYGVDISNRMLKLAKKELECFNNVKLFELDATEVSKFPRRFFDLIFSFQTFQHVEKAKVYQCLQETHKILKLDGVGFFHFPNLLNENHFKESLSEVEDVARMRFYTEPEVHMMLSSIGFKVRIKFDETYSEMFAVCTL